MKNLLTLIFAIIISYHTNAQYSFIQNDLIKNDLTINLDIKKKSKVRQYLKNNWPQMTLLFVSGACDGQVEAISHHYGAFKEKFPNANDQFWNPDISWENKWKNGNKEEGEAFFGSSTIFVAGTDAYHAFRMVHKTTFIAAVTIEIGGKNRKKKKFKHYVRDFFVYSACYTAGFYTTYDLMYR